MHFYKFHINDYAVQTRHLSNDEDLCFRRLLDLYYTEEEAIPLETEWVARRIQIAPEVVKVVLKDFFVETPEGWINHRADVEIHEYHEICKRNAENGKRGGRPSGGKRKPKRNPVGTEIEASRTLSLISNQESISPIIPNGEIQKELIDQDQLLHRAKMLFRMRSSTQLDSAQLRSWKKNKGAVGTTSETEWLLLEWLYAQGTGKGEAGEFRRRDLSTLFSHWNGEIQLATREAFNRGVNLFKKEKAPLPAPEGWRRLLAEICDGSDPEMIESASWDRLTPAIRSQIEARLDFIPA
jgi:uncharacterized protein YdaU (DUF1376 family)